MLEQKKWYDIVLDKDNKWQINLTTGQLFKIEANGARTLVSSVSPHFDVLSVNMIGVRFTWENNKIASVCNYIPHNVEEKNKVTIEYVINPTVTYTTITDVKTNLRKRYILYLTVNTYEEEFLDVNYASLKKLMIWHNNNNSVRTIDETTYNGGDISIFCQTKITVDTVTGDVQSQEVKTYKVEDNALVLTNAYTVDYAYTNDKLTKMQDSNAMVTDYTYKNNGDLELVKTYHIDDVGNQNQTYLQLISQLQDDNGLKIKKDKHDRVKRISIKIGGVLNPVTGKIEGGTCNINSFGYNARGFIKTLESCGTKFEYEYDGWGRVNQVKQNNQNYAEMEYIGDTIKTIYANNEVFEKTNNNYGQPVSVTKSVGNIDETILSYAYDNDQKLISVTDHIENKVINLEQLEIPDFVGETECDKLGRLKMFKVEFGGNEKMQHNIGYRVKEINGPGSGITTTNAVGQEDFIFVKNNTQLYEQTLYMYGNSFYDNKENITSITENDGVSIVGGDSFVYDDLNRLVGNGQLANHVTYEYDGNGNIQNKKKGNNIVATYTYDPNIADRLTSFNGETIGNYDALGNPELYRDKVAVWKNVSQLQKLGDAEFKYNGFGLRTEKKHRGVKTQYQWQGGLLLSETRKSHACGLQLGDYSYSGANSYVYPKGNYQIEYIYSNTGVTSFKLNGIQYWYRKNALGDVLGILNNNGEYVAKYKYNAWGEHTVTNLTSEKIGDVNAIRYRGYYYDTQTKLYYLQSRYYDCETCRFISPDNIKALRPDIVNGLNLYAYCDNNPIMFKDSNGKRPIHAFSYLIAFQNTLTGPDLQGINAIDRFDKLASYSVVGGGISYHDNYKFFYGEISPFVNLSLLKGEIGFYSLNVPVDSYSIIDYMKFGFGNAHASIGAGVSFRVSTISIEVGTHIAKGVKASVTLYAGAGFSLDFSNGFKIGAGFYEIAVDFKWSVVWNWLRGK